MNMACKNGRLALVIVGGGLQLPVPGQLSIVLLGWRCIAGPDRPTTLEELASVWHSYECSLKQTVRIVHRGMSNDENAVCGDRSTGQSASEIRNHLALYATDSYQACKIPAILRRSSPASEVTFIAADEVILSVPSKRLERRIMYNKVIGVGHSAVD